MNFYEKIERKEFDVPPRFDLSYGQLCELKDHAPGVFEFAAAAFKFGYLQGVRAERVGKAGAAV